MEFMEAIIQNPNENQKGKSDSKQSSLRTGNFQSKTQKDNYASFKSDKNGNSKKSQAHKWCVYHESDTHDTGEWKVMVAQAKQMCGECKNSKPNNYASKSKTWNKSTDDKKW